MSSNLTLTAPKMDHTVDLRQRDSQENSILAEASNQNIGPISWATLSKVPPKQTAALALMIATAGGIAATLLDRNYLFALLLFMAGFIINVRSRQKPTMQQVHVDLSGVTVHDQKYPYHQIKSFWINYEPPIKELSLELKQTFAPYIKIPLEDTNPLMIRERIISVVPEKKHEDTVLDQIIRRLGM